MEPGDFIITPAWTWHDHGHDGDDPMVWMDGLDIPIVAAFGVFSSKPTQRILRLLACLPETRRRVMATICGRSVKRGIKKSRRFSVIHMLDLAKLSSSCGSQQSGTPVAVL